jgi:hypothetical protein
MNGKANKVYKIGINAFLKYVYNTGEKISTHGFK